MSEDNPARDTTANEGQAAQGDQAQARPKVNPAFFTCVNEFLELTNRQSRHHGLKAISMASMYAAARFNAHAYLATAGAAAAGDRPAFLDYMTTLYRRMLNEHLDGFGVERDVDVGESELAADYLAAGLTASGRQPNSDATGE